MFSTFVIVKCHIFLSRATEKKGTAVQISHTHTLGYMGT